nr:MAG TPA: hypothetical protein [Caudoviricetes sp.]
MKPSSASTRRSPSWRCGRSWTYARCPTRNGWSATGVDDENGREHHAGHPVAFERASLALPWQL